MTDTLPNEPLPFEPDEVAVLLHDQGGRLFTVGHVDKNSYDEDTGTYRVFEKRTSPHQGRFDVSTSRLVKVSSREQAISLVSRLELLHDLHKQRVYDSKLQRDKAMKSVILNAAVNYLDLNLD